MIENYAKAYHRPTFTRVVKKVKSLAQTYIYALNYASSWGLHIYLRLPVLIWFFKQLICNYYMLKILLNIINQQSDMRQQLYL